MGKEFTPLNEYYAEKGGVEKIFSLKKKFHYGVNITKQRLHNDLYDLDPNEKVVYIDLLLYKDQQGYCYPSMRTLAGNLNLNKDTIQKTIKSLTKKGFLKIEKRWGKKGKAFGYWLKNLVRKEG